VNQKGGTTYPVGDPGWGTEIALDIQAVSAACPQCKILLSCSTVVPKPRFQKDKLCSKRTVADVSAVAQGFAVYDTYGLGEDNGWVLVGGTSLSSPLLAGMMGLAGHPSKIADPAYAYKHAAHYKDITSGRNGYCVDGLCNAGPGYDAPTGIGAPRGLKGL
jgi:subtilase family serine protease